ncbi:MAG TPA: hypothetical protein VMA09_03320 [Candidatus Binataceae bacterium]|nr:hypothetical protein [Candidatus Binataceae bacterium]
MKLQNVPLALDLDEAVNSYDAYSLALTGSDHRGNHLPVVSQGFNDYRMALFDYSLVPMVRMFGLKVSLVRAAAAL